MRRVAAALALAGTIAIAGAVLAVSAPARQRHAKQRHGHPYRCCARRRSQCHRGARHRRRGRRRQGCVSRVHGPNGTTTTGTTTAPGTAAAMTATTTTRTTPPPVSLPFVGKCTAPDGAGNLTASELGSYNYLLTKAPDRLQGTTSPSFDGHCSMQITVHQGDGSSSGDDRDEITGTHTLWRNGEDVWYALAFYPASFPNPPAGGWEVIHQFFAQDLANGGISGGSPPLAVEVSTSGELQLDVRGGAKSSAGAAAPRRNTYDIAPIAVGQWNTLLIHARWSTGSDGDIQVYYRKGTGAFPSSPQVDAPGVNVYTVAGDVLPVYAETGVYRSTTPQTQTMDYGVLAAGTEPAVLAELPSAA